MKKLKIGLAGIALAFISMFVAIPAAQAACYWYPPSTGDHVTYYNCKGPYGYNQWSGQAAWECYADWDWYAEWFWGKRDGYVIVHYGKTCYA